MTKLYISDAQISHVLCEVIVDKFGNVESRNHWQVLKADGGHPSPISRKAYLAAVNRGIPHHVNVYEPSDNFDSNADA